MRREGIALVISAPSGTGKTTLIHRLRGEFPSFGYSVSCTTRQPRRGEVDGRDYTFLSREEFERRRALDCFAEWAEVHGNLYGTPLAPVERMLREGLDVIFDIDVQGARQIKLSLSAAVFVFVLPPDMEKLEQRLRLRGLDDEADIECRLARARVEMAQAGWYDALVVNDRLDAAYDALRAVYLAGTLAPARNPRLVESIVKGLPWRS
ncbi:MAG: guanylate kinase [Desulfovibrio sp.]|jgi:guanylate kinase|nr:guanylate kinase [Desulfovibrio sp.]